MIEAVNQPLVYGPLPLDSRVIKDSWIMEGAPACNVSRLVNNRPDYSYARLEVYFAETPNLIYNSMPSHHFAVKSVQARALSLRIV